eukprot:CAMPEP_0184711210 /NCGR_PEP_ID=MMETSP0314-20130426/1894_1 /TAXON_ID=38298 /ORGANISM="Rhodella maculata, Strain CCMP 736" /LENGTH=1310 /DNA_ID=CAMNT_0027173257 /DNA_START=59 /DNA_END=3991 /DNA_ORIENTATION=+
MAAHSQDPSTITRNALGYDAQLGMLFNAVNNTFYAGLSPWRSDDVERRPEEVEEHRVQHTEYKYSHSTHEAREKAGLSIEGMLELDLKLATAKGSAQYLSGSTTTKYSAEVHVTCTVVRRTRRIPSQTLNSMSFEGRLDNPCFTHYVGEVEEGGTATLSFVQECDSMEQQEKIQGLLQVKVSKLAKLLTTAEAEAKIDSNDEDKATFDKVTISYSGAMSKAVGSFDDACRLAVAMPEELKRQMNTLTYTLIPVSHLKNDARRLIRQLDAGLVERTSKALRDGVDARRELVHLSNLLDPKFSLIKTQMEAFLQDYGEKITEFTEQARSSLVQLRDGSTDYNAEYKKLSQALETCYSWIRGAVKFADVKLREAQVLRDTVDTLVRAGFTDQLSNDSSSSLLVPGCSVLLSLGGESVFPKKHWIHEDLLDPADDDDDPEWFDDSENNARLAKSHEELLLQLERCRSAGLAVTFGVAFVDLPQGRKKKSCTRVGDIFLAGSDKKLIRITSDMPIGQVPVTLEIKSEETTVGIAVSWPRAVESVVSVRGFIVRWRCRPNPAKDHPSVQIHDDEPFDQKNVDRADATGVSLDKLRDDCDYEVSICSKTDIGPSPWSAPVTVRTPKMPSAASKIIQLFFSNSDELSKSDSRKVGWRLETGTNGPATLFVGHTIVAERMCKNAKGEDKVAVRIVDVAPQFEPELHAADCKDDKVAVMVFVGATGHGKSTQINAFLSALLGGDLRDEARLLFVHDYDAPTTGESVTKHITCYRIRPHSPLFEDRTLLIVDTPGFCDTEGLSSDKFTQLAIGELFKTIKHINSVVFTCKANENRENVLKPVTTFVFSLFAEEVRGALRTIFTFSDVGEPQAREVLRELEWPVDEWIEAEVNNVAYRIAAPDNAHNEKIHDSWTVSVRAQLRVLKMLLGMSPVPTEKSAQVVSRQLELNARCEDTEKKVLQTANEGQVVLSQLDALASAVGASPGEKIPVKYIEVVQKEVGRGKATTLCMICNHTCHVVCLVRNDANKGRCWVMDRNGNCTKCPNKCRWDEHKNSKFILVPEERQKMMRPMELLQKWNETNQTLEGALLDAIEKYLSLQDELRNDMLRLVGLTDELKSTALMHHPNRLRNYIDTLIMTAKTRGAPPAQLHQLLTARNALLVAVAATEGKAKATRDSDVLKLVLSSVQSTMTARCALDAVARAEEEKKPCSLYNDLLRGLPEDIKDKAPKPLATERKGVFGKLRDAKSKITGDLKGATYSDNLRAIVLLVKVVLTDGGVVAALAADATADAAADAGSAAFLPNSVVRSYAFGKLVEFATITI